VPENASPEAAAIAAAHHALRNFFGSQAASLDALYEASLAAHALSEMTRVSSTADPPPPQSRRRVPTIIQHKPTR